MSGKKFTDKDALDSVAEDRILRLNSLWEHLGHIRHQKGDDVYGTLLMILDDIRFWSGDHGERSVMDVSIWYPRSEPESGYTVKEIQVGLMDVRASDGFRVSYDFEQDGWVIKQSSEDGDDYQEVAFIKSWQRYMPGWNRR